MKAQIDETDEVKEMKQAIEAQRANVNRATAVKPPSNDLMRLDPNNLNQYANRRGTQ